MKTTSENYRVNTLGHHIARLTGYSENETKTRYMLSVVENGKENEISFAKGYAPYFMQRMAWQSQGDTCGMTLSEVFGWCMKNDFDYWVVLDEKYGVVTTFSDPEKSKK